MMRGVVLLATCCVAAHAFGMQNLFSYDAATETLASCPAATTCPAGYTGALCDLLLCTARGTPYVYNATGSTMVDIEQLATCVGSFFVPVDSHVTSLLFSIYANATTANPTMTLLDPTGYDVTSQLTVTATAQTYTAVLNNIHRKSAYGMYIANINAGGGCTYTASVETNMMFQAGFTSGVNYISSDIISKTLPENTVGALVGFLTSLNIPGFAYQVNVYNNAVLQASYPVLDRLNCVYNLAVGPVTCNNVGDLWYEILGIDEQGYKFKRTDVLPCTAPTTPTTPMPTTTSQCLNGGVYNQLTQQCECGFYYEGTICQQPVCFNGGTAVQNGCVCPPGYADANCLEASCNGTNTNASLAVTGKSLILLVQNTQSMQNTLNYIADYGMEMFYDFQLQYGNNQSNYITNFVIVAFNPTGATILCNTNDASTFQNALFNLQQKAVADSPCSEQFYSGVITALSVTNPAIVTYSEMYVFVNSPPNDNAKSPQANTMLQNTRTSAFFYVFPAPTSCSSSLSTFTTYSNLADFSGGAAMMLTTQFDSYLAMQLIPTAFERQQIFSKTYTDCASSKVTAFVPIDSHSAAVQIFLAGDQPLDMSIYRPDGSRFPNPYTFLQDGNNLVKEVISPCPPGWNQAGTKCYLGIFQLASWYDANADCQARGASLLTILNPEKQALSDFQMGKQNAWFALNDIAAIGNFQWAGPYGQNFPVGTQYTNWAPGQPATSNTANRCGVVKQTQLSNGSYTGLWYLQDCTQRQYYVCEKHTFQHESPNFPPGLYRIDFQTNPGAAQSPYYNFTCSLNVYAQSNMQVFYGFNTGNDSLTSDFPSTEPSLSSSTNRYAASIANFNANFGTVSDVDFYDAYYNLVGAARMTHRTGCGAYQWISDTFTCPNGNFATVLTGIDDRGFTFNRYNYGLCL